MENTKITGKEPEEKAVALNEKYSLTIKEASKYFGIGETRLRNLVNNNKSKDFAYRNGTKIMIKRKRFEAYLDSQAYI